MHLFRRFISYYKPYRAIFYFDMFCALLLSAIDVAFPQILRNLTNGLFAGSGDEILRMLPWIGGSLLAMYLVRFGCQYYITSWGHIMGARMESNMRQDLFDHYQRLSFSYYDRNNTGEMMSKLVSDLFDISELAHHGRRIF
jgi:ATP-binding cassette, subfamily B, bacterial